MLKGKVISCEDKSFTIEKTGEKVIYYSVGVMVGESIGFIGSRKQIPVGNDVMLSLRTSKEHKFFVSL